MKCIIIEDQPPAQRILSKYIQDLAMLELVGTFSDAIQAIAFLKTQAVDVMFLDVHLPKISGLDFLKSLTHPPQVILTTAFADYALEGYELNVVDYLLKPFSFQRFVQAVSKIPTQQPPSPLQADHPKEEVRKDLYIKSGHAYLRVALVDLIFIKSDADYTELHTAEKKYLSGESLRYWEENLDPRLFIRVHKSYIIHTQKIEKIVGNQIHTMTGEIIPLGRAFKDHFMDTFLT